MQTPLRRHRPDRSGSVDCRGWLHQLLRLRAWCELDGRSAHSPSSRPASRVPGTLIFPVSIATYVHPLSRETRFGRNLGKISRGNRGCHGFHSRRLWVTHIFRINQVSCFGSSFVRLPDETGLGIKDLDRHPGVIFEESDQVYWCACISHVFFLSSQKAI